MTTTLLSPLEKIEIDWERKSGVGKAKEYIENIQRLLKEIATKQKIFFKPDNTLAGEETDIAQQTDIMPSVLGYLHYGEPYVAFGRDIFRESSTPLAFNYKDNIYQLFQDDFLLMFDGTRTLGLYNFKNDKLQQENLVAGFPDRVEKMENTIKAVIQQYNNRMIEDRLTAQ